jgi:MoaA/NifB/PqqE/SkfB family radical SAM enzyme
MCARRYRNWDYGDLPEEVFERLSRVFHRVGLVVLGGFGEPLSAGTFDHYFDRLMAARANVAIQTSGYRLTEERCEEFVTRGLRILHVSIDSPDEKTYRSIRPRISFPDVQERVRQITALKREKGAAWPTVQIVFVAMKRNIEQLPTMVELASDLGADLLTVQYMAVHDETLRGESLFYYRELANHSFDLAQARAREIGLALDLPPRFGTVLPAHDLRCLDPWQVAFVRWNGEVRPCCYAPSRVVMGNLTERSFWEIWNGPAYRELRRTVNTDSPPGYCRMCASGRLRGVDDEAAHVLLAQNDA